MWQVLVAAAAAAGSGILARKLMLNPTEPEKPNSDSDQNGQESVENSDAFEEKSSSPEKMAIFRDSGKIFRFSSPGSGSSELKRRTRQGFKGFTKNGVSRRGNKKGANEGGGENETAVGGGGNGVGKKISVCLKKRRIGKHVAGKCESCASKDNSFGWGVGMGIMYMMSAGNAEISKLNCAMDETVKTVQELKAEISRRKSALDGNECGQNKMCQERSCDSPSCTKLDVKRKGNLITMGPDLVEENGCDGESDFKQEQLPEVMDMDRLEAEFESELQKLGCATGGSVSGSEGRMAVFERQCKGKDYEHSISFEHNVGVPPAELDEKLRNLLLRQQESHIVELEAELQGVHSRLHEREVELQALKDCVKRLTQFSLANGSDEEGENHGEEEGVEKMARGTQRTIEIESEFESAEFTVGMKRSLGFDSHICSKN